MKYVIFDIHNTIAFQSKPKDFFVELTYNELSKQLNQKISLQDYIGIWDMLDFEYEKQTINGYKSLIKNRLDKVDDLLREISYQAKFLELLKTLKIPNIISVSYKLNEIFQHEWINGLLLFPATLDILNKAFGKAKCGVVTNFRDARWIRKWINQKNLDYFFKNNIVISEEVGFRKPHPLPFERIIIKMGIQNTKDAIYIGDNPIEDRIGAEKVGIKVLIIGIDTKSQEDLLSLI